MVQIPLVTVRIKQKTKDRLREFLKPENVPRDDFGMPIFRSMSQAVTIATKEFLIKNNMVPAGIAETGRKEKKKANLT